MHTELPIDILPKKVVSLVPSMTETMFELGLGQWLVGCTEYCVYPREAVSHLPKLGGPKSLNTRLIIDLKPELIIANQEENRIEEIDILIEQGITVWGAYPTSVRDAMDDMWGLAGLFQSDHAARIIRSLEDSLDWLNASMAEASQRSYFCPIWKDTSESGGAQWMTFNQNTYMNDLLYLFGGVNVFSNNELENTKNEKQKRYPIVDVDQIVESHPEFIILPDDPYQFNSSDENELIDYFMVRQIKPLPKIIRLEGSLTCGMGPAWQRR